jgi:formylglycine-generating enzyme
MVKYCVILLMSLLLSSCGDSKARKPLVDASLQDMTFVQGKTYEMGSQQYLGYTKKVTLPSFYISKYNVSWKKYDLYSTASGKSKLDKLYLQYHDFTRSPTHPVNWLTWYQANDYCQYLGKLTGLSYDLPTEAQWEYVARNNGNPNWLFPTHNGQHELGKNFPNSHQYTHQPGADESGDAFALPVGSIPCTPQGVCGMSGAVNQWTKTAVGNKHIVRGQGAGGSPEFANVYDGTPIAPNKKWAGFRCVINTDMPMAQMKAILAKNIK